jgi:hypothetical protein
MRKKIAIAALLAMLAPVSAPAQDLAALDQAEAALVAAWNATPLAFRHALFVNEAKGFGIYVERPNVFKPGEPLLAYAEPVGYAWKDNGDGTYSFGFDIDLFVKNSAGEVVGSQEKFQQLKLSSHSRNREFMVTLTLTFDGAPAGDYVVEYRAHDLNSDKVGTISLPFTIAP